MRPVARKCGEPEKSAAKYSEGWPHGQRGSEYSDLKNFKESKSCAKQSARVYPALRVSPANAQPEKGGLMHGQGILLWSPHMQNRHYIILDREQHPVYMRLIAIQQMPDFAS
jgi:hypothetical protein